MRTTHGTAEQKNKWRERGRSREKWRGRPRARERREGREVEPKAVHVSPWRLKVDRRRIGGTCVRVCVVEASPITQPRVFLSPDAGLS